MTRQGRCGTRGKAPPKPFVSHLGPPAEPTRSQDAHDGAATPLPEAAAVALQAAALLLDYPADSEADLALIVAALAQLPEGEVGDRLNRFVEWWGKLTPREREVVYVSTFDLGTGASLYVTSKRSHDKHHRGQELIRLRDIYRAHGWEASANELSDYLPLVLEFAAGAPGGIDLLGGEREGLLALRDCLETAASPFADVVAAILAALADREWAGDRQRAPDRGRPR